MREYEPSRNDISLEEMLGEVMEVKHKEKEDVKVITPYFSFIANIKDSYSDIHEKYTQAFLECKNSMKRR